MPFDGVEAFVVVEAERIPLGLVEMSLSAPQLCNASSALPRVLAPVFSYRNFSNGVSTRVKVRNAASGYSLSAEPVKTREQKFMKAFSYSPIAVVSRGHASTRR